MGGFESACHVNAAGRRLDMMRATQHDVQVRGDYRRLQEMRIGTARDTVRWHLVEAHPGEYDFSSLAPFVDAAVAEKLEVIWDLLHYGWPDDLDIYSPEFVTRFAAFAEATALYLRERIPAPRFYTPINELSFFAWAAGAVGWFRPNGRGRGAEIKRQLVRAWIASIDAIRAVDPGARFVSVEPLINTVPPRGSKNTRAAAIQNESQWEAWELITGRREPELGGDERYLDIVGVNFYHDNQWEVPGGKKIHWHVHPRDDRWVPLHRLLLAAQQHFERPMIIGETSHVGSGRAEWIRELTDEVIVAVNAGVPLEGICLYPIIDRFEWDNPSHWHNSGLWDYEITEDGTYRRVLNEEYATELRRSQMRLASIGFGSVEPETATA